MILPIVSYGDPVLKQKAADISPDYPNLQQLIADMWDTMYNADGVGLAAPQVGLSIRLFVIDASAMAASKKNADEAEFLKSFKHTFINAQILEETDQPWAYEEGCLSIPNLREDVTRKGTIRVRWFDENFQQHEQTLSGMAARVVQHEYDHIEGILFTERVSPLRRQLIRNKLVRMQKGQVDINYPMRINGKVVGATSD